MSKKEKEFGPAPLPTTRGTADIPGTTERVTVFFYGKHTTDRQSEAVAIAKHRASQLAPIPPRQERVRVFMSREEREFLKNEEAALGYGEEQRARRKQFTKKDRYAA